MSELSAGSAADIMQPPPDYMKNNINNYWGAAPDKGSLTGPVLEPLNSSMLSVLHSSNESLAHIGARQNSDGYWLSSLGSAGTVS
jgi:glucan 1,3-beta-glucosidase